MVRGPQNTPVGLGQAAHRPTQLPATRPNDVGDVTFPAVTFTSHVSGVATDGPRMKIHQTVTSFRIGLTREDKRRVLLDVFI